MDLWLDATGISGPVDQIEFCRLYGRAPESIRLAFNVWILVQYMLPKNR